MVSAFSGSLLMVLGCWGSLASVARAQCLSLDQMVSVGAAPTALAQPQDLAELPVNEWVFKGGIPRSHDVYWASATTAASGPPPATVTLRTQQRNFDVVLKTTQGACIRQVSSDLKALKIKPINVTCPNGCEAQRYDGPDYQATLYSKMKGEYPFVIVLHPLRQAPQAPPPAAKATPTELRP